ncbi:unnamed protein product [Symbiodinium sp. CCMP2456]|nr:unnamed protein product [Symbiodinium sp. CCMP2456]
MSLNAAVTGSHAELPHQQGMSPTSTPLLEGESRGPNYGTQTADPLRELQHEAVDGFFKDFEVLYDAPGNEPEEEDDYHVKYLRAGEIQYVEKVAQDLYEEEKYADEDVARLLALVAGTCGSLKVPRAPGGKGMILGAYVHGGSFGVTRYGRDLPWVARYFNHFLRGKLHSLWPSMKCSWTTIALQAAEEIPKHKDGHNQRGTYNYVIELKTESAEGLWVQNKGYERQVVGGTNTEDYQYEGIDGKTYEGCLVDVTSQPAVFDPLVPHAYVKGDRAAGDVKVATVGDCEATVWDWGIYVEAPPEEEVSTMSSSQAVFLRKVCGSDDPGTELLNRVSAPNVFEEEDADFMYQNDLVESADYWASLGLFDGPQVAKLEPEYVDGIEDIIANAVNTCTALRHTYNVSPREAKAAIHSWKAAIAKEVGVVERGFKRISVSDLPSLKQKGTVQELPSKLVYTVKPPSEEALQGAEPQYCKRKARIVCCGNYASEDPGDLYAGGAAAESLRCALTYTASRRWRSGITDITGAFMLTPLPGGPGQVTYVIRPPAVLVQLGLAEEDERWLLTHGMYGLRQSPKLWSAFRDEEMQKISVDSQEKKWTLKKGIAEPNMWLLYEVGAPADQPPDGLILVYVDDMLVSGPLWLVHGVSTAIRAVWKASDLELLDPDHEIRFLGCEIAVNEDYDAIYVHQKPYIDEILRHHGTTETEQSYIQAPKEWVSFEAAEGESAGTEDEVKQAQRACGELLWLAQRSRPDIAYVVCAMGSLLTRAAPRCLLIAQRLRSYLQRTKNLALALHPTGEDLTVFTDSSFAPSGSKSHSGLVAVWLGAPVCWRSARQPFTCLSTAECELLAATEGLVMGKSIESVINQMQKTERILLKIDNQAAITIAKPSSSTSWRTRHLRVRAAYIHEQIQCGQVVVSYVQGKHQWADLLTKSFPRQRLEELVGLWGFIDLVAEATKRSMVKMMVFCMMIQTTRADGDDEPLALTTSMELYIMVILMGIAVVALWELLWWCVDHCCGEVHRGKAIHITPVGGAVVYYFDGEDPVGLSVYYKYTFGLTVYGKNTFGITVYGKDSPALIDGAYNFRSRVFSYPSRSKRHADS